MKAERLPSGAYRYRVSYRDASGTRHIKSFTDIDRETAKSLAQAFQREHTAIVSAGAFSTMISKYIAARETLLSPATIAGYRHIENGLRTRFPAFYSASAYALERSDVQAVLNALSASGASPKTIRNYSGLISSVLRENGLTLRVSLPKKQARDVKVPSEDEVKALIRVGGKVKSAIMLAAFGGLRRGEVCALRQSDICGNVVHVCRDVVLDTDNRWITKPPKTAASDRYIQMPDSMAIELFDDTPRMLDYYFNRAQLAAFGERRYRFHDLRHFCASYMHAQGIPDAYIMKRCGWENDAVLKAVYRHTMQDQDSQFTDKVNKSFETFL